MYSELEFTAGVSQAEFTNAFATLTITVPEGTTEVTLTSDTPLAGTMKVSDKEVVVDNTAENSNVLTVTGSGTTFKAYILPGTHTSIMAAIEDAEGTATKTFSDHTFESGKTSELDLTTDLVRPVRLQLTASAEHSYENNVLTGTNVTLGLGVEETDLRNVTDINITVTANGTTYRTYSADEVSEVSLDLSTGKSYLPNSKGTYTVNCNFVDKNFGSQESTTTFTTSKPNVNLTGSASVNGKVITVSKAEVAISDQVLSEYPMEYARMQIGRSPYTLYNGTVNNHILFTDLEHTCDVAGTYLVRLAVMFDGVDTGWKQIGSFDVQDNEKYQSTGTIVKFADQIKDGGLYVIRVYTGATDRYWKVGDRYGYAYVEQNEGTTFTKDYVFRYEKGSDSYITVGDSGISSYYNSKSAGVLTSISTGKSESQYGGNNLKFNNSAEDWKLYFVFANNYGTNEGSDDIDIYKQNTGMPLYYDTTNYRLAWGAEGSVNNYDSTVRKWTLIEVELVK